MSQRKKRSKLFWDDALSAFSLFLVLYFNMVLSGMTMVAFRLNQTDRKIGDSVLQRVPSTKERQKKRRRIMSKGGQVH